MKTTDSVNWNYCTVSDLNEHSDIVRSEQSGAKQQGYERFQILGRVRNLKTFIQLNIYLKGMYYRIKGMHSPCRKQFIYVMSMNA